MGRAREIAEKHNLLQESDREVLKQIVDEVLKVEKIHAPIDFLVGQGMKKSKGRANPVILKELFLRYQIIN